MIVVVFGTVLIRHGMKMDKEVSRERLSLGKKKGNGLIGERMVESGIKAILRPLMTVPKFMMDLILPGIIMAKRVYEASSTKVRKMDNGQSGTQMDRKELKDPMKMGGVQVFGHHGTR